MRSSNKASMSYHNNTSSIFQSLDEYSSSTFEHFMTENSVHTNSAVVETTYFPVVA